jgi:phage tail sheath protein FI
MSETFLHGVQVLEVEDGARPIRTVRSSVIGIFGTAESDEVKASMVFGTSNAAIRIYAAPDLGEAGNDIRVVCTKPATNNATLAVTYAANDKLLSISLATDGSSVATSTASQVLAAVNAADAPVEAFLAPGSNGSSVFATFAATNLLGGIDATFPKNKPVLVTNPRGLDTVFGAGNYLTKALEAIYKQAGAVVVVVRSDEQVHDATELTGIYALKRAQADLGYTPRIILCEAGDAYIDDLKSVCDSCRATAIVGLGTIAYPTSTDATAFVSASANERIFTLWPTVNNGEDPAPYVAGVLAKSDNDKGFWWSPSNQEVFGITSLDAPVDFQLGDSTSLANVLNEGKVTTFIRQGGFRVWGNLTGAVDPKWQFLSVRRTADIINDSILYNHLWAVDRNITRTYLEDVTDGVNAYLATLTALGAIIGGRCWPDPDLNTPSNIALGKVYFTFEFTPPYPAQTVTFRSILTNEYLAELID